jgi:DNA-binding NarL/FixJ family response regulator
LREMERHTVQSTHADLDGSVEGMARRPAITVLIADKHDDVRSATRDLVEDNADVTVVALTTNVGDTIRLVRELKPDLVLIDAWLSGGGAEYAAARIREICPATHVAVLTSVGEPELARRLRARGAIGCFHKEHLGASIPAILASVRE